MVRRGWSIYLVFTCIIVSGCRSHEYDNVRYRITGYDASTHQWAMIWTGYRGEKPRRLTMVCNNYLKTFDDPSACDVSVGSTFHALTDFQLDVKDSEREPSGNVARCIGDGVECFEVYGRGSLVPKGLYEIFTVMKDETIEPL